jgi:hypothetical protein
MRRRVELPACLPVCLSAYTYTHTVRLPIHTFLPLLPVVIAHAALVRPRIIPAPSSSSSSPWPEGRRLRVEPIAHGRRRPQGGSATAAGDKGGGLWGLLCEWLKGRRVKRGGGGGSVNNIRDSP